MIQINQLNLQLKHNLSDIKRKTAKLVGCKIEELDDFHIVKKSIDARKKPDIYISYTVRFSIKDESRVLKKRDSRIQIVEPKKYTFPKTGNNVLAHRPIIIGMGPAGLFCGYYLAKHGYKPIILERGKDVEARARDVEEFWNGGKLNPESNVQFGEGGAGTFSDGKLNTGVNNPRIGWVLEQFVAAGAREDILFDAKPHVGTDVLLTVVQNIRQRIISLGGEVQFNSQVTALRTCNGSLTGLVLEDGSEVACEQAVFAIGHSARDTFAMLHNMGLPMEPKPFSMGVRIEHPQSLVDKAQYGKKNPVLPPADYKLVKHLANETVYTFCMCPGGYVVAAASEEGRVVTNGMSYADRAGSNANAALLVTLNPKDFPEEGPLGGVHWQQRIEETAFVVGGGNYCAPAQRVGDFLAGIPSTGPGTVQPTYRPGVTWCDLHSVLPEKITGALKEALPLLDGSLRGYSDPDAVLTAPETRSSSPVRILRGEDKQSTGLKGFYPAGEGAGYAGGIMSAAIDGILCAEALIKQL